MYREARYGAVVPITVKNRSVPVLTSVSSPDLHLLRVFVAVTEAGGFSAAQLTLNVSQSTISTQMSDLEARLGLKLCRRGRSDLF
ncbi:LysR family transcriptional regulator [Rhizobium beringeri]